MINLKFKSTEAAFEYAQEYFGQTKLSKNASFIGIVRLIDAEKEPTTYLVEILCKAGSIFKKQITMPVAAIKHPELLSEIRDNDLVIFGPDDISGKIPSGYLLHKLEAEIDAETKTFKICTENRTFKVFVDDHFHYMNEDERYLYGEFETLEDALSACKKIIDECLDHLLKNCSLSELKDQYYSFGDDPFIEGNDFSSSQYAEEKIKEIASFNTATERGLKHWKHEIDYKYGLLLAESEMLEGEGFIHFCQTDRNKLCASWDIQNQSWQVNVERPLLEGLSFTTPKRFEEIVFAGDDDTKNYYRKQYLIEYLLFGVNVGETKTLTKEVDNGSKVEFSLDARTWNKMLIGNAVGVEGGICKYFEPNSEEERVLTFGLLCKDWEVNIEIVFDDYEDYEQHSFPIKHFGGYYT